MKKLSKEIEDAIVEIYDKEVTEWEASVAESANEFNALREEKKALFDEQKTLVNLDGTFKLNGFWENILVSLLKATPKSKKRCDEIQRRIKEIEARSAVLMDRYLEALAKEPQALAYDLAILGGNLFSLKNYKI